MAASGEIKLIDAHCHVNFNAYKDDADAVIERSLEQGIGLLTIGSQSSTSERAVDYAEKYAGVWAAVGLHPIHLFSQEIDEAEIAFKSREERFDPEFYRALAGRSKKVVAVGECGLDYYRPPKNVSEGEFKARQKEAFRSQLDLSFELGLPVMIHCREAHHDVAEIIEEYAATGKKLRGNIHCFTGTWLEAERYLKLGFYVSFTGVITFPPKTAGTLREAVEKTPLDKLLVETDAPYLAPVPLRGRRNEPAYVKYVAMKVAEIKGIEMEEVEAQTLKNTRELFGL